MEATASPRFNPWFNDGLDSGVRLLAALMLLLLQGCATHGASQYCGALIEPGEAMQGSATIANLGPQIERRLRSQLPRDLHREYLCWYNYEGGLMGTTRRFKNQAGYGYRFHEQSGSWSLVDDVPFIVALPRSL